MPSVLIEVRKQYPPEQEVALMDAVHSALREAFYILSSDKNVRFVAHEPHRFACPPTKEKPELYTHISIDFCWSLFRSKTQFISSYSSKFGKHC